MSWIQCKRYVTALFIVYVGYMYIAVLRVFELISIMPVMIIIMI